MTDDPDDGQLIGSLLDALGVRVELGLGQQLTDVLILGKAVDFAREDDDYEKTSLVIATSQHLDWILARGLLSAAQGVFGRDAGEKDE